MKTIAYQLGQQHALEKLGFEFHPPIPRDKMTTGEKLRKIGPALGGLAGLAAGALYARKNPGHLLRNLVGGFGTGATVGWAPDVLASGYEALTD